MLLSWAAISVAGEASPPLTLSAALQEAAHTSFQAQVSGFDLMTAREETRQIRSLFYPSADMEVSRVNLDNDPYLKIGTIIVPSGEQAYWKYQVAIREIIWDWGRRKAALLASRTRESAVALQGVDSVRQAQSRVLDAYMDAITLSARRHVIDQRTAALKDHLRTVQDLFEHGVVARNDLLRTEVALRNVEDQAADIDNKIELVRQSLNVALGREPFGSLTLPISLPLPPVLPWDIASCRSRAIDNNTILKALTEKLTAEEQLFAFRKKDFYPTFIAQAFHSYEQNRYVLYPHVTGFIVGLNWNIYDGGVRETKVHEAQIEADRTRCQFNETRKNVEIAAEQAHRDYEQALKEAGTARVNVAASDENLRIIEDQYKEGMVRTTDVLDAESLLAESRFMLAAKRYEAYQKQGALLSLMGEDLPGFYEKIPVISEEEN